ncbi:hypothetical protein GYA49_05015 [Candidatus Beckwithbacteria bacterium]|nr:hypothetical protein [Candidatus Beckwithbacteria bacterium]
MQVNPELLYSEVKELELLILDIKGEFSFRDEAVFEITYISSLVSQIEDLYDSNEVFPKTTTINFGEEVLECNVALIRDLRPIALLEGSVCQVFRITHSKQVDLLEIMLIKPEIGLDDRLFWRQYIFRVPATQLKAESLLQDFL